jgi:hypothetical protein
MAWSCLRQFKDSKVVEYPDDIRTTIAAAVDELVTVRTDNLTSYPL